MKFLIKILALLFLPFFTTAQPLQSRLDSLHIALKVAKNDTVRMNALSMLASYYDDVNLDSSLHYFEKAIMVAKQLKLRFHEVTMIARKSWPLMKQGDYPGTLKALNIAMDFVDNPANEKYLYNILAGEKPKSIRLLWQCYIHEALSALYSYVGNYEKAVISSKEAIQIAEGLKDTLQMADSYSILTDAYVNLNKPDSALYSCQKSVDFYLAVSNKKYLANVYIQMGEIQIKNGDINPAKENFEKAIQAGILYNNSVQTGEAYLKLASLYQGLGKTDFGLKQSKEALAVLRESGKEKSIAIAYRIISDCYIGLGNEDSSFFYLQKATLLKDKLDKIEKEKIKEFQTAAFEEALRSQELEKEKIQTQNKFKTYSMLAELGILSIIGFILYLNNRQKRKANLVLLQQKQKVESTLQELKSTQSQLIQSEKMASLGELTAGIAHEIQNPLNFVNNFSEVNTELIDEAGQEIEKGNFEEVKIILNDIKENEQKINHHGKGADAIVKGMLQHSRSSSSVKELTDINALCDEYLRLSYHGLRAKDKSFNATIKTDFDESIGNINIIQQDIGRVVLNLINNAFYVVDEKKKQHQNGYEPTVSVSTKKLDDKPNSYRVLISVKDNGNGIPQKIVDKIFQPFFTTKPTGQGTGLGLSLSYDIIKAHGGKIRVSTNENQGTEFTIQLPTS